MRFKVTKISYSGGDAGESVYPAIRSRVRSYFRESGLSKYANRFFWIKAIALVLAATGFYVLLLVAIHPAVLVGSYIIFSWLLLLTGFNIAHDAAHGCLTGKKKTDSLLFEATFCLLGANPYLWKIRHIYSHHPYPNVEGCDADIELSSLLRFSPQQPLRGFHKNQHRYAPFLYSIYTLYWIFYKDWVLFFRGKQANIHFNGHPLTEWIKLFAFKLVYLGFFILLPIWFHPGSAAIILLAFIISHFINSLFLLFTFLVSHHVPQTHQAEACTNKETIAHSWAIQQIRSSADFHAEEKWAYWLFGGFNAHVAHHLFPGVCHVHYPAITKIIREELSRSAIPYHSFSWWQGIRYHLQLLKWMGSPVNHAAASLHTI